MTNANLVRFAFLLVGTPTYVTAQTIFTTQDWQYSQNGTYNGATVTTELLGVDNAGGFFLVNGDTSVPSSWAIEGSAPNSYSVDLDYFAVGFANFGESVPDGGYEPANTSVTVTGSITLDNALMADVLNGAWVSSGLLVTSAGGFGNTDGSKTQLGDGGVNAGNGGTVNVTHSGAINVTSAADAEDYPRFYGVNGIFAGSFGGAGAEIQAHDTPYAGNGGDGGALTLSTDAGSSIQIGNTGSALTVGLQVISQGGLPAANSGVGNYIGNSGVGGAISITHGGSITNSSDAGVGIYAASIGGAGGTVEYNSDPRDIYYGVSGAGGTVDVVLSSGSSIVVSGNTGIGVLAASTVGDANQSAYSNSQVNGESATVTIDQGASVSVGGAGGDSFGIGVLAISAGTSTVLDPFTPGNVSSSGSGYAGPATVANNGSISSQGEMAIGIAALAVGGSGIVATGNDGLSYLGNNGLVYRADGAAVTVTNGATGSINTLGSSAHGIVAISTAGGGLLNNAIGPSAALPAGSPGNFWVSGGILGSLSSPADGAEDAGYTGGKVTLTNEGTITTGNGQGGGNASIGIVAQSIGGGGGSAGGDQPSAFVGDAGGNGGDGGEVTVNLAGSTLITTYDLGSVGVLAQSIGGGGGNGANASGIFVATGGQGGSGGTGGDVTLTADSGTINTFGNFSGAIVSHSIGGGGGNGGYANSAGLFIDASIGGNAGGGGAAGTITTTNSATLTTTGNHSPGIVGQSIGGGGGIGGAATSYSVGVAFDVAIALGGTGGGGGAAGDVTISNSGAITTGVAAATGTTGPNSKGADSVALLAQAIGGGGGYGGAATSDSLTFPSDEIPVSASFSIAHGATGGAGGNGGTITLANTAALTTYADGSHAILAQSIGGGGGNGGDSTATAYMIEGGAPSLKVAMGLGGSGGVGGNGQSINVTHGTSDTPASIVTYGQFAAGIVAHSIGAGGGNGGAGNSSDSSPNLGGETGTAIDLTFAIGGQGAGAGDGSGVTITQNSGSSITTYGSGSAGIIAQSIGGGGGTGGGGSAAASGDTFEGNLSVGGVGGSGDDGGNITVTNNGIISTKAGDSHGILAHSIGGGGGTAGTTDAAATISTAGQVEDALNQPSNSYSVNLAVGHSGGGGGNGGTVSVTNTAGSFASSGNWIAGISTQGNRSFGILVQSIAGGGGTGGAATSSSNSVKGGPSGGKSGTYSVDIAVGSNGGSTGDAGDITIDNSGVIATAGYGSHAIIGQSIGGGGGVGGEGTVDSSATHNVGGNINGQTGNNNGNGGAVTIENTGGILTTGADAVALLAQSIGGGGGLSSSGDPTFQTATPANAPSVEATLGLNAGSGGNAYGGQLTLSHSGAIVTQGDWSHGILGQSIGAGGGKVSSVFSDSTTPDIAMSVGAAGGTGNGGIIGLTLDNATISTGLDTGTGAAAGYSAIGIFLQSVGGGGGVAHDGSLNGRNSTATVFGGIQTGYQGYGAGGAVSLSGSAAISTFGEAAHGVLLQSIGGSGGFAAQGNSQFNSDSAVTNDPVRISAGGINAIGAGGDINATATLQIQTQGDSAFGLLAQSVGGGGGIASAQNAAATGTYLGGGNQLIANEGGDLGITLNSDSQITTAGDNAHAIFAQSVGGGGGIANYATGDSSYTLVSPQSYSGNGSGGTVTVDVDAAIATTGDNAYGILAQSVGGGGGQLALGDSLFLGSTGATGNGSGGNVQVTQSGSITTTGSGSVGVFAQSTGPYDDGQVLVILNGSVQGGSAQGVGVWIDSDSASNEIGVASGASLSALSSIAVQYTGTTGLNVVNNGLITGSTFLGQGTFTNNGTYSVGAAPSAMSATASLSTSAVAGSTAPAFSTATVDGNFAQTANGTLMVDTDFSAGEGDLLHVTGDANIDGTVVSNTTSVRPFVLIPVLKVDGDLSGTLDAAMPNAPTTLFKYGVTRSEDQLLLGVTDTEFSPTGFQLDDDQRTVGQYLDYLFTTGGNDAVGQLFSALDDIATGTPGQYGDALDQLAPRSTLGFASRRTADMRAFSDSILSYPRFEGDGTVLTEGDYSWSRIDGRTARQDGSAGFRINTVIGQVGMQQEIADGFFLGGVGGIEASWLDAKDGQSKGDGQGGIAAVTLKYQTQPWLFEAAAFGSVGFYKTERTISIPGFQGKADGSPDIQSAGVTLKAAYTWGTDEFYLRPSTALNTIYVHADGYNESGAGALNLEVSGNDQTTVIATPALEIGARFDLADERVLRTFLMGGVDFLSNDGFDVDGVSFAGAPSGSDPFSTSLPMDDVVGRIVARAQLEVNKQVDVFLQYEGEFSDNVSGHGGAIGMTWWF